MGDDEEKYGDSGNVSLENGGWVVVAEKGKKEESRGYFWGRELGRLQKWIDRGTTSVNRGRSVGIGWVDVAEKRKKEKKGDFWGNFRWGVWESLGE